jgi:hypothetical protein
MTYDNTVFCCIGSDRAKDCGDYKQGEEKCVSFLKTNCSRGVEGGRTGWGRHICNTFVMDNPDHAADVIRAACKIPRNADSETCIEYCRENPDECKSMVDKLCSRRQNKKRGLCKLLTDGTYLGDEESDRLDDDADFMDKDDDDDSPPPPAIKPSDIPPPDPDAPAGDADGGDTTGDDESGGDESGGESGNNTALIVGLSIGGGLLLLIFLILVGVAIKKRAQNQRAERTWATSQEEYVPRYAPPANDPSYAPYSRYA